MQWKPRTVLRLAITAYALAGGAAVAAASAWAKGAALPAAAVYVAGLWVIVVLLVLRLLPPLRRGWAADNLMRLVLWGAAAGGGAVLAVLSFAWPAAVFGATIGYLLIYWLVASLYLSHDTPPDEWMRALKALTTGISFSAMAMLVTFHFSPTTFLVAGLAFLAVGILVGMVITYAGATFVMGLSVFTIFATGLGYALGDLFGNKGWFVAGSFCLSILTGLNLRPLPSFPRALLAALVTTATGIAGGLLGAAFGAPLAGALAFLAAGAFLSMMLAEERVISLALFSVLSALTMSLGFAGAFYTGGAAYWVGALFCVPVLIYMFSKAPGVRLALLLVAPVPLMVGMGFAIGNAFDHPGWTMPVAFVLALIFDVLFYFGSDSKVLAFNDAWVVSEQGCPRPYAITRRLAAEAGLPPPRIALIGSDAPNLFTVGRSRSRAVIAVTSGLLEDLDDDELEAVLAHELSHVRGRDLLPMTLAAALASPVGAGAKALAFEREGGSNWLTLLAVGVAAPFFAMMVQLSYPRSREKLADAAAARMIKKREALAGALEKLELGAARSPLLANPATGPLFAVNPFRTGWLVALFSTHPSTEERVAVLREAALAGG